MAHLTDKADSQLPGGFERPDESRVFVRPGRRPLEKSEFEIVAGGDGTWMADEGP